MEPIRAQIFDQVGVLSNTVQPLAAWLDNARTGAGVLAVLPYSFDVTLGPQIVPSVFMNTDAQAVTGAGYEGVAAKLQGLNDATNVWDRVRVHTDNTDAIAPGIGNLAVYAHNALFNGTTWDRMRAANGSQMSRTVQTPGLGYIARAAEWNSVNAPAANVQATVTRAAGGAGVYHVLTGFQGAYVGAPAAGIIQNVQILFGAALQLALYIAGPGTQGTVGFTGLNIIAPVNTSVTVQFSAAGGAGVSEVVSMQGYSISG